MDFNQVRYFLALAETLNFTRAAQMCDVSQPALTQAIRRLEEELGDRLLVRDGAQTRLSELGDALLSQFRQIDRTRNLVKATAKSIVEGTRAHLDIGIMYTIGPNIITSFLDNFKEAYPQISVVLHDVKPGHIVELLLSGALDGAFCSREGSPQDRIVYTPLFEEDMVVAVAKDHRFVSMDTVAMSEVAREPYIDRLHCEFRERFFDFIDEQSLQVDVVASSDREDWIQSIVANGTGVTLLPTHSHINPAVSSCPLQEDLSRNVEFATANSATPVPALGLLSQSVQAYTWPDSSTR